MARLGEPPELPERRAATGRDLSQAGYLPPPRRGARLTGGGAGFRVLTYNVHGCVGGDRRLDVGRISAVIAAARPDIVALQELDVGRARSGRVDQAHDLARRLGMACHFQAAMHVADERYGDAVLTAWPMRLVRAGRLPRPVGVPGLETRGALWVAVEVDGRDVQVINTHLGLLPMEQGGQVRALLGPDWAGAAGFGAASVLLGDFNATPRYAAHRALAARFTDAAAVAAVLGAGGRARPTFPARLPLLRIDHVFTGAALRPVAVEVPPTAAARSASDHRPLMVDLAWNDVAPA